VPEFATSIDIEAPPEIVFAHLVTPEGILAWLGQHAELDATPGGVFAVDIDGNPVRGEYLEIDPPHSVVISWGVLGSDALPAGSSRVEFRLTPIATGTRLDLTHTGLPADEQAKHAVGWPYYLARLGHHLSSTPKRKPDSQ
jgi:uncharacterized protein YndB with AHSA1/START domain